MLKTCFLQACHVRSHGFRYQDVFESSALAADFQIAVCILPFEFMMHLDQQFLHLGIFLSHFLREYENAAVDQAVVDPADHGVALLEGKELKCVIHDDHRGLRDIDLANITFDYRDIDLAVVGGNDLAASPDHRWREIDRDDFTARGRDVVTHSQCSGTERATQVITPGAGPHVTGRKHADRIDGCRVAGDRTLEHIGKYIRDRVVELERPGGCLRLGKNPVTRHFEARLLGGGAL